MNRSSTVMILGESWRFGNLQSEDNFKPFKIFGVNIGGCGHGINRSSTVAG